MQCFHSHASPFFVRLFSQRVTFDIIIDSSIYSIKYALFCMIVSITILLS